MKNTRTSTRSQFVIFVPILSNGKESVFYLYSNRSPLPSCSQIPLPRAISFHMDKMNKFVFKK
jgi:hypothetical protein